MSTTSFTVHPEVLGSTANALDAGSTSLDVPALNSCDVAMFSTLAGGAASVAEASSGTSANNLLAAYGNTGARLARDLKASAQQYQATELAAIAAAEQITTAVGAR